MSKIDIKNLVKSFGNQEVLHGIDISISKGEFCVLVGPSGCGKSTTLRMVAGLETISGGEISIGDRVVNGLKPRERGIAMVFQNYALYPSKTVFNNMAFSLQNLKIKKKIIDEKVREIAKILDITELLDRKPATLSGGQRQRVAMGRAIVRDPEVFLFDEPLSNLDAQLRGQMRAEIKLLHQRLKNTVIYVTHDQVEAMTLADKIVIMKDGKIEQQGTPDDVFNNPQTLFVASFMGSPPMNLTNAKISKDGVKIKNSEINFKKSSNLKIDKNVVFGIRADNIRLPEDDESGIPVRGFVTLVEQLGTENLAHFNVGDNNFIAKTNAHAKLKLNKEHSFNFNMKHAYFFDPETGARIS
jgi:multiple sugar transport system ATP-binding protein|tara:strand:- start:1616 stop:2683 length:1068 start_codon:yes stop_codon:yes gene_type:complete